MEEENPFRGLVKQLTCADHYAMLLPVPDCEVIKCQTLDDDNNPWGGSDCHLSIELLFCDPDDWETVSPQKTRLAEEQL